jgi:adenosylmethionine-8-amino-7-oxononanoate aminotransferase
MEAALKITAQYWQLRGQPGRHRFVAFDQAYHGDTFGASSLGGIPLFRDRFNAWHFPVEHVGTAEELDQLQPQEVAAVCIEPLIQGAAGMRVWPRGLLAKVRAWCTAHEIPLIADEVLTGFGRTGTLFACNQENVVPDFLLLAKGLTAGYSPLGATLVADHIARAFLEADRLNSTFFHGHSYTGHALGCAVALENLAIFREERTIDQIQPVIRHFQSVLQARLGTHRFVRELRLCGLVAGIELRSVDGAPFDPTLRIGHQVCLAARKHGVLTRPIRDTVTLLPPLCITPAQIEHAVEAIAASIVEVLG